MIKDEVVCKIIYDGDDMPYGINKVLVGRGKIQRILETAGVMDLEKFILEVNIAKGKGCENFPTELILRWIEV
jgi:hypothetical protein